MPEPTTLLLIRHGEKPDEHHSGTDWYGHPDDGAGLIPKGWARAGALATLFDPNGDTLRSTLPRPDALVSPRYANPMHRTYLTLLPLSDRVEVQVIRQHAVTDVKGAAKSLLDMDAGVVLVCWEHENLVDLVQEIGRRVSVTNPGKLPTQWPDDRFDVIWRFDHGEPGWTFATADQQLLHGDVFDSPTGGEDRSVRAGVA